MRGNAKTAQDNFAHSSVQSLPSRSSPLAGRSAHGYPCKHMRLPDGIRIIPPRSRKCTSQSINNNPDPFLGSQRRVERKVVGAKFWQCRAWAKSPQIRNAEIASRNKEFVSAKRRQFLLIAHKRSRSLIKSVLEIDSWFAVINPCLATNGH